MIQPIVVRRLPSTGAERQRYQIIAGERRWRAAQRAGLLRVPVVVKDVADTDRRQQLEMALIENIQRENLNPMEEAAAYQRLVDDFQLRQEDIATRVGKDRATVANVLRLLKLPEEVRGNIAAGEISMGHARAILGLATEAAQRRVARDVIARGWSVRETEALVKKESAPPAAKPTTAPVKDVHTRAAEEQLHLALGTPVDHHAETQGRHDRDRLQQRRRTAAPLRVPDRAKVKESRPRTRHAAGPADRASLRDVKPSARMNGMNFFGKKRLTEMVSCAG